MVLMQAVIASEPFLFLCVYAQNEKIGGEMNRKQEQIGIEMNFLVKNVAKMIWTNRK